MTSWENIKATLLDDVSARIDAHADSAQRPSLHNLRQAFFRRFPAEDLRGRSAENLYGCLYGLLHFLGRFDAAAGPRVRLFNPQIDRDGWESGATVLVILCREMPFCTASVRGEINRRQLPIHALASCNLATERAADGTLQRVLAPGEAAAPAASRESLLYFEIGRHSDLAALDELRLTLAEILGEVARVVDDFDALRARLDGAAAALEAAGAGDARTRAEAAAFLDWLKRDHATLLGYEYIAVAAAADGGRRTSSVEDSHLGVLRGRETRGALDLAADLERRGPERAAWEAVGFGKSRRRSRVHRQAYPDYVEVPVFDDAGMLSGQHRFLLLYTAGVYTMSPTLIPILRRKVEAVLRRSGLDEREHDGRELLRVLELFPRDELFQASLEDLYATASAVNRIQERKQTRLFVRRERHDKFVSCLVYMPRDRYTTERRQRIQDILEQVFAAEESEFTTLFTESTLVRVHVVLRVDPRRLGPQDVREIEEQIVQATMAWEDRLRLRLVEEFGEERGERYLREIGAGFSPGYRDDFDPRIAVLDIHKILGLDDGAPLAMNLYRLLEEGDDHLRLRLYRPGAPLPLSDVLPILENLGLRVVTERAYPVRGRGDGDCWIQEFALIYTLAEHIDLDEVKGEFEDAFRRIWFGEAESDSFNRLLLGSRLSWREIALLRAYACYLRQINFPYSVAYIAETMADHLHLSAGLVEYFLTRFSPDFEGDGAWREAREAAVRARVLAGLEAIENLGQDRILRQYLAAIAATRRTNFFQSDGRGELKSYFSFKLYPGELPDMPRPVPCYEVYVYSPRCEGVHLRGGKVARGGLRWSDRLEDFRTEVLGLVKAQQVKNAVIVPVGAKGGFVCKRLGADWERDAVRAEGEACYQLFIRGLLDITDNRVGDAVVPPPQVVVKDDPDPYLVVAADKGTASFSDIANGLAAEYGFWLGDAFASGGSVGYDHKKMGITARGAWVSVSRHFRELGLDIATTPFTVVGIGDMSGDVFGNGMLLSPQIRLVAAFDHRHVFIDPDPDPGRSLAERRRLFSLPGSSWADYAAECISAGGGVFPRSAKAIPVSPAMRARFAIGADHLTPSALIGHLLRASVDLLWNGGVGTWVKASREAHTDVGDKANDSVRVDADTLRCRVVGEGGNLGMTQRARVEFALRGGRLNTDFIDNAAGVDCSDHEVNIKILLDAIVARGDLTTRHRNALLGEMTDSVAALVLANNYRQAQAISLAAFEARARSGEYRRLIADLEASGRLDRELEFLPGDEELAERAALGKGLTRPELALLVSYSKAGLKEALMQSPLDGDARTREVVRAAFPPRLVAAYPEDVDTHRLHREILCTQLANDIVNRMGPNFVRRQQRATGASVDDVARAYQAAMAVFAIEELWDAIEGLDAAVEVGVQVQLEMMLDLVRLVKRATRWLLRNRRHALAPSTLVDEFGAGVAVIVDGLPALLRGAARELCDARSERYRAAGVPAVLARRIAAGLQAAPALAIRDVAARCDAPLETVADLYFHLGERLELDWYGAQILASAVDNEWQAMARESYLDDLQTRQSALATGILEHEAATPDVAACLERWEAREAPLLRRWRDMLAELHATTAPDFAMFAVANRELLDLAESSRSR